MLYAIIWSYMVLKWGMLLHLLFNKSYVGNGSSLSCFEDGIERPEENFKWY